MAANYKLGFYAAILLLPGCGATNPFADLLPNDPPDETNRLAHPAGYSLVFPSGWKGEVQQFPDGHFVDGLNTNRRGKFGSEDFDKPSLYIMRFSEEGRRAIKAGSYLDRMRETTFQKRQAWTSFEPGRLPEKFSLENMYRDSAGGYPYLTQSLLIRHNEEWFLLCFHMRNIEGSDGPFITEPLPIIQEYFETYRFEPRVEK